MRHTRLGFGERTRPRKAAKNVGHLHGHQMGSHQLVVADQLVGPAAIWTRIHERGYDG